MNSKYDKLEAEALEATSTLRKATSFKTISKYIHSFLPAPE